MEWDDEGRIINYDDEMCWERERRRRFARADGAHIMGKPEAKMMRKIQAENNLTEEEVREHKKYRKMLADAARNDPIPAPLGGLAGAILSPRERFFDWLTAWAIDEEMAERLYKRFVGIELVDGKRPEKFHYTTIAKCHHGIAMRTIDQCTDGMFVYDMKKREVGFMYESNVSMFTLSYQYKSDR